jgi:hypothetical protein
MIWWRIGRTSGGEGYSQMSQLGTEQFKSIKALESYCRLYFEIVGSVNLIGSMLDPLTTISDQLKIEISYLQFRKVCELISVGCLLLHGDLKLSKQSRTEWHAGKIVKMLSNLHKDFFPVAGNIEFSTSSDGKRIWKVVEKMDGQVFDIQRLQELYRRTGENLHFGTVSSIPRKRDFVKAMSDIKNWLEIIVPLVNSQIIKRKNEKGIYFIDFKAADGKPSVSSIEINADGSARVEFINIDLESQ